MIDRAEEAEESEADGDTDRAGGEPGRQRRGAAAEIEQNHHVLGAPAVAEPARRQRRRAEENVARDRQRQELAIGQVAEMPLERQHHRRVEQHQKMREEMPDIRETHRKPSRSRGHSGTNLQPGAAPDASTMVTVSLPSGSGNPPRAREPQRTGKAALLTMHAASASAEHHCKAAWRAGRSGIT